VQRELKQCKSQMAEQHKTLVEYSNRMDEYDKKNEETNRKFSTLLQVSIKLIFYYGFHFFL
jgi:F-box protein 28